MTRRKKKTEIESFAIGTMVASIEGQPGFRKAIGKLALKLCRQEGYSGIDIKGIDFVPIWFKKDKNDDRF